MSIEDLKEKIADCLDERIGPDYRVGSVDFSEFTYKCHFCRTVGHYNMTALYTGKISVLLGFCPDMAECMTRSITRKLAEIEKATKVWEAVRLPGEK